MLAILVILPGRRGIHPVPTPTHLAQPMTFQFASSFESFNDSPPRREETAADWGDGAGLALEHIGRGQPWALGADLADAFGSGWSCHE